MSTTPDPITPPINDPTVAFQRLLDKYNNDGIKLAAQLFDENYQYRTQLRELKAKEPKDGAIVLTDASAKKWKAYEDLGVEPSDLKKAVDKVGELEKANKELSGMESLREIADLGLEGSRLKLSVLKDQLARFPDAAISFKTEKDKDGKEAKVAYIKKTAESAETKFEDFAKADLADYLPSLKVSSNAQQPPVLGSGPDPAHNGQLGSVFDRIRESVKAKAAEPVMDLGARFGKPANS